MTTTIWTSAREAASPSGVVVTIGNFDGVHRGHQAVLTRTVAEARARGARSVAMTFEPHPLAIHRPEAPPELIAGPADRIEWLGATGVDGVLVQPYDLEFASQTPEQFVRDFLVGQLGARAIVVGADVRFGRDNSGGMADLIALGAAHGLDVMVMEDEGATPGERWSSSRVRELLAEGDMEAAARVLGRPHRLRGTVVHGDALGREIGFPTANLDVSGGMIPRHGVYAGWLTAVAPPAMEVGPVPAAISVGLNYTVGGTDLRVEAHIIDGAGIDLYGATVVLDLVAWRRPMLDFGGLDALIVALGEDVEWCRDTLGLRGR